MLKDRDLSGELKDIWGAVQAKRLREKDSAPSYESYLASQNQIYIDFDPSDVPPYQSDRILSTYDNYQNAQQSPLHQQQEQIIQPQSEQQFQQQQQQQQSIQSSNIINDTDSMRNGSSTADEVDSIERHENSLNRNDVARQSNVDNNRSLKSTNTTTTTTTTSSTAATITPNNKQALESDTVNKNERPATKKEKLSGFLPNGCHNIFPFMKAKTDKTACKQTAHNNKILNNDTTNLETEIAKLDIGKMS